MRDQEIQRVLAEHHPTPSVYYGGQDACDYCEAEPYPCETAELAKALISERAEHQALFEMVQQAAATMNDCHDRGRMPFAELDDVRERLNAMLEASRPPQPIP